MAAANVVVEVEFTAGVWTDVSARVDLEQPFTIRGGRSDAFSDVGPTALSGLVLRNTDGAFTPGNAASTYYPNVKRNKRIRVKVVGSSTVQEFIGYIDAWDVNLSSGPVVEAQVSATDRFKILTRTSVPEFVATVESIRQGVCFDAALLLNAAPATGRLTVPERFITARVTAPQAGYVYPIADPPSGVRSAIHFGSPGGSGPVIYLGMGLYFNPSGIFGWFRDGTGVSGRVVAHFGDMASLTWGSSGSLVVNSEDSSGVVASTTLAGTWNDGNWHYFELKFSGTTASALVDRTTATASGGSSRATPRSGAIGGRYSYTSFNTSLGSYADYADPGFITVTPSPVADPFGASIGDLIGEPISTRLSRVLSYIGFTNFTTPTTVVTAGAQNVSGTVLSIVQDLARTEGTWAYIDPADGLLKFGSRDEPTAVTLTVDAEADLMGELEWSDPDTGDINEVTATGSGATYTATDAASVTALGKASGDVSVLTADTRWIQAAAEWQLAKSLSPLPRVPKVTVDLLTGTTAGLLDAALATTIGSRVRITNAPSADIGLTRVDLSVQAYEWTIGLHEFTLALDTDRADDPTGLVVEDVRYGRVAPEDGALTLSAALNSSATSCTVASTAGNLITTAGADVPMWLQVDGECLQVSAVVGGASPQTLTITRGQEGTLAAAHLINAPVTLWLNPTLTY